MFRKSCLRFLLVGTMLITCLLLPLAVFAAETVIYSNGFENDSGGYTSDGTANWTWGAPVNSIGPPSANSGQKCWGTQHSTASTADPLKGNLYSPRIDIPELTSGQVARVSFYAYIDIYSEGTREAEGDFYIGEAEAVSNSIDNVNWQRLGRFFDQMRGGWQRYQFDVSEYSGKSIHLRFWAFMKYTKPGFYIDDVALTVEDSSGPEKLLTLEASEDASAVASCPWVYPWNGTEFIQDNDIYSVARQPQGEMRDYYLLQKPLVARDSRYYLEVHEIESEDSWTDYLELLAVDHHPDVTAAPDGKGNVLAYRPANLVKPESAVSNSASDVLTQVSDRDNKGYPVYSGDYIDLDFGKADVSNGARVLLRVKGFLDGIGFARPFTGPPAIVVQVRDGSDGWQEVGRLNPRFEWSEGVFDLSSWLPDQEGLIKIRLLSISHDSKYHEIDYVALAVGPLPKVTVTDLPLQSATFGGADVLSLLKSADNQYVQMGSGNKFSVSFAELPLKPGEVRDFILVSEGYYIPHSDTFFIYTWDGTKWAQRDSYSFAATDSMHSFNLSSVLPDPTGGYRVRIWQDYSNFPAAIDFVKLQVGTLTGTLNYAADLRNGSDIMSQVNTSDDIRFLYPLDSVTKQPLNRWTGFKWSGLPANVPPAIPTGLTVQGNTISWIYYDQNGHIQSAFDMQAWTGPGATGTCIWSPPTVESTATTALYGGPTLISGTTYYVRVRLNDGISWGGWAEASFDAITVSVDASASPPAGGSVSGAGTFSYNSTVTVTATVATGYQFVNWSEGGTAVSTTASYAFPATANRTLVAHFAPIAISISVSASPTAGGSVSGAGSYSYNSTAIVTATAATGYQFVNWSEGGTAVSTTASYAFPATANRTLVANFVVKVVVRITTSTLPNAIVGQPYSKTIIASGGVLPYTWSVTSGSLPTGLTLIGSTGIITGTPTQSGRITFTVQVRDSNSASAAKKFSIKVNPR